MIKLHQTITAIAASVFLSACTTASQKPDVFPVVEDEKPTIPISPSPCRKIRFEADISFEFDKAELSPEEKNHLDEIIETLQYIISEAMITIVIAGHSDPIGSDLYNQRLSERRAETVRNYLVLRGLDSIEILSEGKGKSQSITGNSCNGIRGRKAKIECHQPDRRAVIEVIGGGYVQRLKDDPTGKDSLAIP